MKTKHTPAPWTQSNGSILDKNGFGIAEATEMAVLQNWPSKKVDHWSRKPGETFRELSEEEAEANAYLIAAAPELLEALESVYKHMTAHMPEKVIDQVISAINKAKGL